MTTTQDRAAADALRELAVRALEAAERLESLADEDLGVTAATKAWRGQHPVEEATSAARRLVVLALRARRCSWAQVGMTLTTTGEAAEERFAHLESAAGAQVAGYVQSKFDPVVGE